MLSNPAHIVAIRDDAKWFGQAFEEGIRWVAPIQTSSRRATEGTEIRGCEIAKDQIA